MKINFRSCIYCTLYATCNILTCNAAELFSFSLIGSHLQVHHHCRRHHRPAAKITRFHPLDPPLRD